MVLRHKYINMFRAIGFLIILWGLTLFLEDAFYAFEDATIATFDAVESAALVAKKEFDTQL